MPWIVTSPAPLLLAAQINTQAGFDRTFRTILSIFAIIQKTSYIE